MLLDATLRAARDEWRTRRHWHMLAPVLVIAGSALPFAPGTYDRALWSVFPLLAAGIAGAPRGAEGGGSVGPLVGRWLVQVPPLVTALLVSWIRGVEHADLGARGGTYALTITTIYLATTALRAAWRGWRLLAALVGVAVLLGAGVYVDDGLRGAWWLQRSLDRHLPALAVLGLVLAVASEGRRLRPRTVGVVILGVLGLFYGARAGRWELERAWDARAPATNTFLVDVSPDGTGMLLQEEPSGRLLLRDAGGARIVGADKALRADLGPGGAVAALRVTWLRAWEFQLHPARGRSRCLGAPANDGESLHVVWRGDGRGLARKVGGGVLFEDLDGGCEYVRGAISAAYAGAHHVWSDGATVFVDGRAVGYGGDLTTIAGAAYLNRAGEDAPVLYEVTRDGLVRLGERPSPGRIIEVPGGVCLVEHDAWGAGRAGPKWASGQRCWHPGSPLAREMRSGWIPLAVDIAYDPEAHRLVDLAAGTERALPPAFAVGARTRLLPDGRLRTFDEQGYDELGPDGTIAAVRWGTPPLSSSSEGCSLPVDWRSPVWLWP
ncbi:MAG: hypothetical protein Q8P41_15160 [Pseudomonadota bacterium]|nr:hypothetical protein [Pseudomonadota bacterium]